MTEQQQAVPAYVADCWYMPENTRTVFSARKGKAYVYVGWVLLYDAETSQEVTRVPVSLASSPRALNGCLVIDKDGKKQSMFSRPWAIFFNPQLQALAILPLLVSLLLHLPLLIEVSLLLAVFAGLVALYWPAFKKAKLFVAQAKHYAGIAPATTGQ